MEDMVLKYAEFGVLGVITLILLTKGLNALNELARTTATLSEAQKALADSIARLADKVATLEEKTNSVSFHIEGIEKRLDKLDTEGIEKRLDKLEENAARNFNELRDLIKTRA